MVELQSLAHAELFKQLTPEHLAALQPIAREFGYRNGEYLFRFGDEADTLFVMHSGRVQLMLPLRILGVEKEIVTEEVSSGGTVAWSAMIEPYKLTMSARATNSCTLVGFSRVDLLEVCAVKPDLGYRLMANVAVVVGRRLHVTKALWFNELQRGISKKYG